MGGTWMARARGARVRRALTVLLLLNVSVGMAVSVIFLRHHVDVRRDVDVEVVELDRLVAADALAAATGSTRAARPRSDLDDVRAQLRRDRGALDLTALDRTVRAYLSLAGAQAAPAELARAAGAVHTQAALIADRQRDANRRAGQLADGETLFMMVFAAGMVGLLFRRVLAAREAELRAARDRARAEARFRSLVHHSADLISVLDADTTIRFQTPSLERLLGWVDEELRGTLLTALVHPEDEVRFLTAQQEVLEDADGVEVALQVRVRHRDGTYRHLESVFTNLLRQGDVHGVVVNSRDVTERVALQDRLQHSALHDPLTGLANRVLFADRVSQALGRDARDGAGVAVLFIDLDDFKGVNDAMGHLVGDELLVGVAGRLRGCVRGRDTVARLGGDEFAVLLEDVADVAVAVATAARFARSLLEPFALRGSAVTVFASVGIALGDTAGSAADDVPTVEALLSNADIGMYAAKAAGRGQHVVYTAGMATTLLDRMRLRAEIAQALEREEFEVHYQPVITLATGAVHGVEALVRWRHPVRGLVPPDEFIAAAESSGQIVPLGRWVLETAARTVAGWHAAHPEVASLTLAVNLSARELSEPDLVERVIRTLADTGLAPARLVLEVTESMLLADMRSASEALGALRALEVGIAIDDFGTGYSSLSYLEQLSVDILKIDKSFVDRLSHGRGDTLMVQTITHLGHALGLALVAEGVEDLHQVSELQMLDVDFAQGFYFSRPLPAADLEALLRGGTTSRSTPGTTMP